MKRGHLISNSLLSIGSNQGFKPNFLPVISTHMPTLKKYKNAGMNPANITVA
jgi:hypothetical protein